MAVSDAERRLMEHATGWDSREPLFRNHFVTEDGTDDWPLVQELCKRGLMKMSRGPSELSGGMPVFRVTELGIEALRIVSPKKPKRARKGSRS